MHVGIIMIEYFRNQVSLINDGNFKEKKIKQYFIANNHYHKFLMDDEQLGEVFRNMDAHDIIRKINKVSNNTIVDYELWPESNALYIKCKIAKFHYKLHDIKLIKKFNNIDEYLTYCLDNVVSCSKELYPTYFGDWRGGNVAIQKDLSWILVDYEDIFNEYLGLTKKEFINGATANLLAGIPPDTIESELYDVDYAKEFIQSYFKKNVDCLDFIKNP